MAQLLVLADANSFYASCEQVFNPSLVDRPVVVLSNNDGCVVARSPKAKALGISNGTPWFQIQEQAMEDGVVARSSNYELYASMSARMMSIMGRFLPGQEVYSIDECFLRSPWGPNKTMEVCARMREAVLTGLGIPVSVGIAPTKTLAKIANHWAKDHPASRGVTLWSQTEERYGDQALASVPIEEVWGVGRRLTRRLQALGLVNALDLRQADRSMIRHRFSITLERTVLELRGIDCIEDQPDANEGKRSGQIICSRMFSQPITGFDQMSQALSVYSQKACRRLRHQGSLCCQVSAFCASSPYNTARDYISLHRTLPLPNPSDDPLIICKAACDALRDPFDPRASYIRAGVVLVGLVDKGDYQTLPGLEADQDRHGLGMVLDEVNHRFGAARVGIGYGGIRGQGKGDEDTGASWTMRRELLSPRSTTRWDEMAVVRAS
ncbi:ImpB [Bifidobacterium aemilianum]|uniref:ImpB n=1 Tax=Bifidobacterium aemilianum TaxID=2493120 RepID=A0A366KBS5_9BIFI|nr:Y-family DNA polymerase [Bifidobacterium aemilianum]RBP98101.1 ImpB [Bifidobacterium aemilianum]